MLILLSFILIALFLITLILSLISIPYFIKLNLHNLFYSQLFFNLLSLYVNYYYNHYNGLLYPILFLVAQFIYSDNLICFSVFLEYHKYDTNFA